MIKQSGIPAEFVILRDRWYSKTENFGVKLTNRAGTIKTGTGIYNSSKEKEERVGRMLLMHANSREDIKEANAGDIVALAGLKYTITGHTLCDEEKPVLLEPMEFPDPVIEIAVEPKTKADQEKMGEALGRLAKEDPSFRVTSDEESGPVSYTHLTLPTKA